MCYSAAAAAASTTVHCVDPPSPLPPYSGTVDIAEFFRFMDIERTKFSEKVTTARGTHADWRPLT